MSKFIELLDKTINLYGSFPADTCIVIETKPEIHSNKSVKKDISQVDFRIFARYEGDNAYKGYNVDMIPNGLDRILYGYIQFSNCAQNKSDESINYRWQKFINNDTFICDSAGFASGDSNHEIYSDNPHADFASWPPNSVKAYSQSYNDTWNYNIAYNGTKGLNNIANIAKKLPVALSLGGPVGSVQLVRSADDIGSLVKFYNEFLPSAMQSPFLPSQGALPKNVSGVDLYFEPQNGIWFQAFIGNNLEVLFNFLGLSGAVNSIANQENNFANSTISVNGLPGLSIIMMMLQISHYIGYIFTNMDAVLLNTYNYHYKTDDALTSLFSQSLADEEMVMTNCHSPLFYDKDLDKQNARWSFLQNQISGSLRALNADILDAGNAVNSLSTILSDIEVNFNSDELFTKLINDTNDILSFFGSIGDMIKTRSETKGDIDTLIARNLALLYDLISGLNTTLVTLNNNVSLESDADILEALSSALQNVNYFSDSISESLVDINYLIANETLLQKQAILQLPLLNVHVSAKLWSNFLGNQPGKVFISASLFGKEVSNIVADNVTDSLYKSFYLNNSTIADTVYNDNKVINPLKVNGNGFGSSIVSRLNAGILEEGFNENAGCAYAYDKFNHNFVSYDNELSIIMKICYIIRTGLGGLVFSNLGDDQSNDLVNLAIDVRANFVNYCKENYSSEKYPGPYDFSFENIDRLIGLTENATNLIMNDFNMLS